MKKKNRIVFTDISQIKSFAQSFRFTYDQEYSGIPQNMRPRGTIKMAQIFCIRYNYDMEDVLEAIDMLLYVADKMTNPDSK